MSEGQHNAGGSYSQDEVRRILERAADRQEDAERATQSLGWGGLSLAEVEEIASEVGIDAEHVRSAAIEIRRTAPPAPSKLGIPSVITHERSLSGRVEDEQWHAVVEELRSQFGLSGIVTDFGEIREWASTNYVKGSMAAVARIEPDGENSLLTIRQEALQLRQLAILIPSIFGMMGGGVAIAAALAGGSGAAFTVAGIFAAIGVVLFPLTVAGTRKWCATQAEAFRKAADAAERVVRSAP